jgi:hypothetical protein
MKDNTLHEITNLYRVYPFKIWADCSKIIYFLIWFSLFLPAIFKLHQQKHDQ